MRMLFLGLAALSVTSCDESRTTGTTTVDTSTTVMLSPKFRAAVLANIEAEKAHAPTRLRLSHMKDALKAAKGDAAVELATRDYNEATSVADAARIKTFETFRIINDMSSEDPSPKEAITTTTKARHAWAFALTIKRDRLGKNPTDEARADYERLMAMDLDTIIAEFKAGGASRF